MVTRRSFLATTSVAAAGLAIGCHSGATAGAPTASATPPLRRDRIGVQLYTVRDQMEKDFNGTLERVAQIGFKEVEFAGYYNHSPADVRSLIDRLGLTAPSSHIGLDVLQKDLAGQIQAARTIGHEFITIPALMEAFSGKPIDADFWQRTATEFNRIAKALQAEGIGFAYHNHSFEFAPLAGGGTGYDILLAQTDPALVKFELDLLWATFAGQDPVAMFKKSPGRYVMWHVKDLRGVQEARQAAAAAGSNVMQQMGAAMPRITAVGTGDIDFRRIFAEASTAGLRHFFVENDAAPNTPSSLGDIKTSFDNLKKILA
jgi:sugar phosphate isomerase/epimerase